MSKLNQKSNIDNQIRLKLLNLLKSNPEMSQREMMKEMKVSLGKINYCISNLTEKGMIKVERFKSSKRKSAYAYKLTPHGIEELGRLTLSFLKLKIKEHDEIKNEIKKLAEQLGQFDYNSEDK
ncbi:MAG: MarR family EPS-associated transcriptional regulator [Desulforegulaceae bacterium]|nr:MarR family EPS-associated transcriptional regulator [Desulforegulaceae bacterium]